MRASLILLLAAFLSLVGCAAAGGEPGDSLTLNGSVLLDTVPADAVLTVTLEDVSLADAPAVTLARTQVFLTGQPSPIPFVLNYSRAEVKPQGVYAVRARVTRGDRLLFTTTERNQVDALDPSPVQLSPAAVGSPDVSLTETYWKLLDVDGTAIQVADQVREPSLILHGQDGRFSGSGGVNRLMGGYTLVGGSLSFSPVASTLMAGPPEAMAQEQAIVAALGRVVGYRIAGDRLILLDGSGQPMLTAVAVALR